jgi:hypothetical protein
MVCPDRWRESFAAGDELREKYNAIPEEVLAEGYVRRGQIEEGSDEGMAEWHARYEGAVGITDELVSKAVGPDVDEVSDEEGIWRLEEYLADAVYGKKGFRIHRHMQRIMEERRGVA